VRCRTSTSPGQVVVRHRSGGEGSGAPWSRILLLIGDDVAWSRTKSELESWLTELRDSGGRVVYDRG